MPAKPKPRDDEDEDEPEELCIHGAMRYSQANQCDCQYHQGKGPWKPLERLRPSRFGV